MLVNRSDAGHERSPLSFRIFRRLFFSYSGRHCSPLRDITRIPASRSRNHVSPSRRRSLSFIFDVPLSLSLSLSLVRARSSKSSAVTQFTFSKFTLCQKYLYPLRNLPRKYQRMELKSQRERENNGIYGKLIAQGNIWHRFLLIKIRFYISLNVLPFFFFLLTKY